jgi:hypothetical protein
MGHDVYYFEDTGQWPYNPLEHGVAKDCAYNLDYLSSLMSRFGLQDRWAYRFPWQSQWFGLSASRREAILESADLLINVSFSLAKPSEYRRPRMRLACIDSDPVFTQIKLARGQADFKAGVDSHDVQFSFGENLTERIPETGHHWRPTRQPIVLDEWKPATSFRPAFTTVMNWSSYKPVVFDGRKYAQKDVEFAKFLDLPGRVAPIPLELAVNAVGKCAATPVERLSSHGWRIVDPAKVCPDIETYRAYIGSSRGEWSVAKNGYVAGQPGWFSCRSACYLASGRPVVVQDTGFGEVIPTGRGVLTFSDVEGAVGALRQVDSDYQRHASAALDIAAEYFDSTKVLRRLVETAMNPESCVRESSNAQTQPYKTAATETENTAGR